MYKFTRSVHRIAISIRIRIWTEKQFLFAFEYFHFFQFEFKKKIYSNFFKNFDFYNFETVFFMSNYRMFQFRNVIYSLALIYFGNIKKF